MWINSHMMRGMKKTIKNMTKKKNDLYFMLDEMLQKISEYMIEFTNIKHTKKTIHLMKTLYMGPSLVHTIKMT